VTPGATCWLKVQVGEGSSFWNTGLPFNRLYTVQGDGLWHQFHIVYTAPSYPSKQVYTRLNLECFGAAGNVMFVDDISATVN